MCGIAGFLDFTKQTTAATLRQMTDALTHRGPDDAGYEIYDFSESSVGFGQRRLSILDLSASGHQPMHFADYAVDYNGEIYNFSEIRGLLESEGYQFSSSSDTEVILKAYDKWGMDMLHYFNGMFAIALVDRRQEKLFLVRDRAGVKPMHIYRKEGLLLFASELKSFHAHPAFEKQIDFNSLALFLQYSYIPAPYSIFKHTTKLLPGHWMSLDLKTGKDELVCYWDVDHFYKNPKLVMPDDDCIDRTEEYLKIAYNYRMVADVPVGVFLSGGYDSSSVAALLQTDRTDRLKTFTIGFSEAGFNEAPDAKRIAEFLGTDHTEWYVSAKEAASVLPLLPEIYDEPFADNSSVPTVLVSQLAAKQVKVALSADGGDEIFGGYNKFKQAEKYTVSIPAPIQGLLSSAMSLLKPEKIPWFRNSYNFSTRYEKLKLIWRSKDPVQAVKFISQYTTATETQDFLGQHFEAYATFFDRQWCRNGEKSPVNDLLALDFKTFLVNNNLNKVDRATMAMSLEGREPMLDFQLVEFLAQLPASFKIRNGQTKWLLKQVVHRHIPQSLMDRPKKPFIAPLTVWFKDELSNLLKYYLAPAQLAKTGLFNEEPIVQLRDRYLRGEQIQFQKLWQLLSFQLWYDRWIAKL
jgi:asparagine synthase (glutamine-hydrolysing)